MFALEAESQSSEAEEVQVEAKRQLSEAESRTLEAEVDRLVVASVGPGALVCSSRQPLCCRRPVSECAESLDPATELRMGLCTLPSAAPCIHLS